MRASRILSLFSKVTVRAVKDLPEFKLATETIPPKRRGTTFKLPLWIALALEGSGFVDFENASDISWFMRAQWRESVQKGDNLSHLPPAFYPLSARLLARMRSSPVYPKYEAAFDDILSMRLRKIVNLALKGAEDYTLLSAMTDEERALFRVISSVIKRWREAVREL